jgi:hypothetical protein
MPTLKDRATLSEQPSTTNQATFGSKELPMLKTTSLRTITIATCATLVLVLTGIRCTSATPPAPADTPKIPTYTYKTVVGKVVWPPTSTIDQAALAAIFSVEREKLKLSGVSVLVSSDLKFLRTAITMDPSENGYSFGPAEWVDGLDTTITGGHVGDSSDAPVPDRLYEPDPNGIDIGEFKNVSVGRGESLTWEATWGGYGHVGYLVSLQCKDRTDPRCADNKYLIELVRSLVFVGGNFIPYETTILDQ